MEKKLTVLFFLFLLSVSHLGYTQELYKSRLIKDWQFLKGDLGGIWEAVRNAGEGSSENILRWDKIELPHCFNGLDAVDPNKPYYQGAGWYRTLLTIDNPYVQGRVLLHFEGAGQKTDVYIYTTKVGSHVGGYDEWTVDITDAIEDFKNSSLFKGKFLGKIPLSIRCDNSRDLQMIPSNLSDFSIYGGLYRYLNIEYVPSFSVDRIHVASEITTNGVALVHLKTLFHNPHNVANAGLQIRVVSPSGKIVGQTMSSISGNKTEFEWTARIMNPVRWSTVRPQLYTVEVTLKSLAGTQALQERIGIRDFTFKENGPFFLNGERLLLRGTHRHEDHAGIGSAMTESMMRKEMIMIKSMGANFIRLGHYQQSRIILDLCDSLGILVWEEIPWCRGGLGNEIYQQQARTMLTNMIQQHYNHPAVIIWGLGNENDWPGDFAEFDKEKIRTFMKELNDLSHTLDSSRKTAIRRCDFCKDIVDVYSPSIWAGWYRGKYSDYKEISEKESKSVKHFLHVEWGGDSHAGRYEEEPETFLNKITDNDTDGRGSDSPLRLGKDGNWSETYVCNLIDWHLKEQETMPWLSGTAFWVFKDFSTPGRPDNPVPFVNQKGVVERDFTTKSAYYVFQSYWTEKPMVHIFGHTWPVRWGNSNEPKMIKVYSNCDEVELFVNGKSVGIKKRNAQDFPAAGLRWMVVLNEGTNMLHAIGKKGKIVIEDKITQQYQTARWSNPAKLIAEKIHEEKDMITVEVKVVDSTNVLCLDATNWIHFSLAGDGILIDNQGTPGGSRKVQAGNGRAVITLKTNNAKNVMCVQSPSLPTIFLTLDKKMSTP